jgi:hypothetical protein
MFEVVHAETIKAVIRDQSGAAWVGLRAAALSIQGASQSAVPVGAPPAAAAWPEPSQPTAPVGSQVAPNPGETKPLEAVVPPVETEREWGLVEPSVPASEPVEPPVDPVPPRPFDPLEDRL